ncbi:MAG: glycogen synthase GlgA, partial [Calditrichaeota bacterium]
MMRGKFNVLFVSSEIRPFVQGGCTAEFSGTFPKFIKNLGHDIRLMMPNYKLINERKFVLRDVIRLQGMDIKIADKQIKTNGKSSFLPEAKVQIYFLDNKYYFDREGLYEDPASGKEYKDNPERFMYFCKSCLETLKMLHWQPDVIHCNDWQTALIPVYLKTLYKEDPFFKNTHTLLTIHDFTTQGNYNFKNNLLAHELESLGLALEGSFLKDGIRYADLLNTISEAHLQEVLKNEGFNFNLADVLNEKKDEI